VAGNLHPGQRPPDWQAPDAPPRGGLKWWQWLLIGLVALFVLAALMPREQQAGPDAQAAYSGPSAERVKREMRDVGRDLFTFTIPPGASPRVVEQAALLRCEGKTHCAAHGWFDAAQQPKAFPMLDREVEARVFSYVLNRATGHEQVIWTCEAGGDPRCGAK
jgi:hypothetical protein